MTKTITRDDVLRYIYKETSAEETSAVEKQLVLNTAMMEFYNQSVNTIRKIKDLKLEPSVDFESKILNYSGSFNFESFSLK